MPTVWSARPPGFRNSPRAAPTTKKTSTAARKPTVGTTSELEGTKAKTATPARSTTQANRRRSKAAAPRYTTGMSMVSAASSVPPRRSKTVSAATAMPKAVGQRWTRTLVQRRPSFRWACGGSSAPRSRSPSGNLSLSVTFISDLWSVATGSSAGVLRAVAVRTVRVALKAVDHQDDHAADHRHVGEHHERVFGESRHVPRHAQLHRHDQREYREEHRRCHLPTVRPGMAAVTHPRHHRQRHGNAHQAVLYEH